MKDVLKIAAGTTIGVLVAGAIIGVCAVGYLAYQVNQISNDFATEFTDPLPVEPASTSFNQWFDRCMDNIDQLSSDDIEKISNVIDDGDNDRSIEVMSELCS